MGQQMQNTESRSNSEQKMAKNNGDSTMQNICAG